MSTSANVIEYTILKDREPVGYHRWNIMCKTNWTPLLQFTPPSEYLIVQWGYEEEEMWEDLPINLEEFLKKVIK